MGGAKFRRDQEREKEHLKSIIPDDVKAVFGEADIERTWDFLERVFHLNKEKWKAHFEKAYSASPKYLTKMEMFARFGLQHFKDPINRIVYRQPDYPNTWFEILRYVVKDKLNNKTKETKQYYIYPSKR